MLGVVAAASGLSATCWGVMSVADNDRGRGQSIVATGRKGCRMVEQAATESAAASVLTKVVMTDVLEGDAALGQADQVCNLAPVCRAARCSNMRAVQPQHWGWRQTRETFDQLGVRCRLDVAAPETSTACSTGHTATVPVACDGCPSDRTCMLQDSSSSRDEHRQEHSRGLTPMKTAAAQLLGVVAMFIRQWSREHGSQAKMGCTESAVGDSGGTSKALTATEVVGGVPKTKS